MEWNIRKQILLQVSAAILGLDYIFYRNAAIRRSIIPSIHLSVIHPSFHLSINQWLLINPRTRRCHRPPATPTPPHRLPPDPVPVPRLDPSMVASSPLPLLDRRCDWLLFVGHAVATRSIDWLNDWEIEELVDQNRARMRKWLVGRVLMY